MTKLAIEERLDELHAKYREVPDGMLDPELEAQIRELHLVLGH